MWINYTSIISVQQRPKYTYVCLCMCICMHIYIYINKCIIIYSKEIAFANATSQIIILTKNLLKHEIKKRPHMTASNKKVVKFEEVNKIQAAYLIKCSAV